jgi:hypothetical protein
VRSGPRIGPRAFAELLSAGVERLVDVRELPLSRRRGFSKTALSDALRAAGIDYVHVKALGTPKPNRERYWASDVEGGAAVYRKHLHNGSRCALIEPCGEPRRGSAVPALLRAKPCGVPSRRDRRGAAGAAARLTVRHL